MLLFCAVLFLAASAVLGGLDNQRLTEAQQKSIVDLHNSLRASVSPAATNMETVVWDSDAENYAAEWATCANFDIHRYQKKADTEPMGENLAMAGNGGSDFDIDAKITSSANSWWGENADYNYEGDTCSGVCGHYTQMAWANSNKLGCAYATNCAPAQLWNYDSGTEALSEADTWDNGFYMVCNYMAQGNWVGVRPYSSGSTTGGTSGSSGGSSASTKCSGDTAPSAVSASRSGGDVTVTVTPGCCGGKACYGTWLWYGEEESFQGNAAAGTGSEITFAFPGSELWVVAKQALDDWGQGLAANNAQMFRV